MKIDEFKLEHWLNPRDPVCKYNLGASCVKAFQVDELFEFLGLDVEEFLQEVRTMSLHYGHFDGLLRLREALAKLYRSGVTADMVLTVHGATGANNLITTELLSQGDNAVVFVPNYQQHYSGPESFGIEVRRFPLKLENGYLPDLSHLETVVDSKTKMIIITNPNNPSGSFIEEPMLRGICRIAEKVGAYVLSDEIYRGLADTYMHSVVDIYDKGIATHSTSKVYSMAGTRIGWIVTKDPETHKRLFNRRSYDTICCGVFDELLTAIALEHFEKILERSRGIVNESRAIFDKWLIGEPRLHSDYKSYSTTALVKYDYDIPNLQFCNDIYENTGVLLSHGDCFELEKTFRLGYGFGDPAKFEEALTVLSAYLRKIDSS